MAISGTGKGVSVRSSVVDVRFEQNLLRINDLLRTGQDGEIILEVQSLLDERKVRTMGTFQKDTEEE